ncbi:MAG: tetratricopeptide repeat protein [bacterium]
MKPAILLNRPGTRALCLAVLIGVGTPGCMLFTTKRDGDRLRKEVTALSARVELMKKGEKDTLDALTKAKAELVELKGILPKARAILLRSSARFGVRLEQLSTTVAKLQGRLENMETDHGPLVKAQKAFKAKVEQIAETLERVRSELTKLIAEVRRKPSRPAPQSAPELFAGATIARLSGRMAKARQLYDELLQRFSRDRRAEAARYWIAKTYFDSYDYRNAIVAVSKLLKISPQGRFEAKARLLSARSYFELKRCKTALRIMDRLVKLFPNAEVAPDAKGFQARLRRLQNVPRYCQR